MGAFQLNGTNYVFGASAFDRTTLELTSVDLNSLKSDLQHITTIKAIPKGGPNDFDRTMRAAERFTTTQTPES